MLRQSIEEQSVDKQSVFTDKVRGQSGHGKMLADIVRTDNVLMVKISPDKVLASGNLTVTFIV